MRAAPLPPARWPPPARSAVTPEMRRRCDRLCTRKVVQLRPPDERKMSKKVDVSFMKNVATDKEWEKEVKDAGGKVLCSA